MAGTTSLILARQLRILLRAGLVLAAFGSPNAAYGQIQSSMRTGSDSVGAAWRTVYAYIRAVDHYARPLGELPVTLGPVAEGDEAGPATDPWGHALHYRVDGRRFEVRSSGSDGLLDSKDDIVGIGMLGRNEPCEIRTATGVTTGVGYEPPCPAVGDEVVLPFCPSLIDYQTIDLDSPSTGWDSVLVMGRRLVRIARAVDGIGRGLGGLPLTLRPVPGSNKVSRNHIADIWGRVLRYRVEQHDFEVRSAGPDGVFDTDDDVTVTGHLGHSIPCAFTTERGIATCPIPPPPCAGETDRSRT